MAGIPERTQRYRERFFDEDDHPYRHFERAIEACLRPDDVVLEVGCGRKAEVVAKLRGKAARLIGLDPVTFELDESVRESVELVNGDMEHTGLPSACVDLVISRALMEHVEKPRPALAEMHRILKPGGRYVFLAPNLGDYGSIAAWLTPNKYHADIVKKVEGRALNDTFPTYFRCNTKGTIRKLSDSVGLELERCDYLGQYPAYFQFNSLLFLAATGYEKLISKVDALRFLRGWLLVVLRKPEAGL
ncbi:MAG: class I SAM-dependent methyltransferase [Planctomycetes bacterium]|nr:class I SAM-dependent methyltransferase [Planctomycetota bacterium]